MLCCIKRSLGVTVPSLEKFRSTLSAKQQSNKKSTVGVRLLKAKFEKEWGGGGGEREWVSNVRGSSYKWGVSNIRGSSFS